jgi:hypothetical protein
MTSMISKLFCAICVSEGSPAASVAKTLASVTCETPAPPYSLGMVMPQSPLCE